VNAPPEGEGRDLHSAGGVVARKSEKPGGGQRAWEVVVMRSGYGTWVFPKGGVEPGERPEEAARREIEEEVGLVGLSLVAPLGETEHEYRADGQHCRKRVDWFLFLAPPGAEPAANAREHALEAAWFDARTALSLLTHQNQRNLLRRAMKVLGRLQQEL